jgi:hypothetical protein
MSGPTNFTQLASLPFWDNCLAGGPFMDVKV